jgi:hypothetical protein
MFGGMVLQFREKGHRVSIGMSGEVQTVRRVADASETFENVEVPCSIELTTSGGPDPDMHVRVELRDGSPVLTELSWKSGPGQSKIQQKHLRHTDIAKLVTDLVVSTIHGDEFLSMSTPGGTRPGAVMMSRERRTEQAEATMRRFVERQRLPRERRVMTDEFLQEVAQVYRENLDKTPTRAVGEVFNVKPRMASTYVDRARRAGYLPRTKQGQKKA